MPTYTKAKKKVWKKGKYSRNKSTSTSTTYSANRKVAIQKQLNPGTGKQVIVQAWQQLVSIRYLWDRNVLIATRVPGRMFA